MAKRATRMPK